MEFGKVKIGVKFTFQYEQYVKVSTVCAENEDGDIRFFMQECIVDIE